MSEKTLIFTIFILVISLILFLMLMNNIFNTQEIKNTNNIENTIVQENKNEKENELYLYFENYSLNLYDFTCDYFAFCFNEF